MRYPGSKSVALRRQRGAALIVAMLVFAICAALIVAMKREFTLYYQRGANLFQGEQAYSYLLGAEDLAALALVMDFDQDAKQEKPRDDLTEVWAQKSTPYALEEGGWLVGGLEDLQGRFNLNSLLPERNDTPVAESGNSYTASQRQFIRLLQALEGEPLSQQQAIQITESIGDWLDADRDVSANGAEDDHYYSRTPAHRAANRKMSSVSELRAVANVTAETYCALLPLVTVWPQEAERINIHTAPVTVLRSINAEADLSPLSEAEGVSLDAQRKEIGFVDVAEFLQHPALAGREMGEGTELLGDTSSWFLLSASVEVADRTSHLYSILQRRQRQIGAVARNGGVAEPICARLAQAAKDSEEEGDGTK